MSSILSTKLLSSSQKELLLNANQSFVAYDAITIEYLKYEQNKTTFDYYIFTSKNGVKAFLKNENQNKKPVFCVGKKTKICLEENGFKVAKTAHNSMALGKIIAKSHKNESFLIFSGNLRRAELGSILHQNNIYHKEIIVYTTHLNYKRYTRSFDGILFFSPSGVQSFIKENRLENSYAFCIGNTTAMEAKKHTNQVIIANKPSIENVLVQAIKHFRTYD